MNMHDLITRDLPFIDMFYRIVINLNKSSLFFSLAPYLTQIAENLRGAERNNLRFWAASGSNRLEKRCSVADGENGSIWKTRRGF